MNIEEAVVYIQGFETAELLAHYLEVKGVVGIKEDNENCPLANWFHGITGCVTLIDPEVIEIQDNEVDGFYQYTPTKAVIDFINRFDSGEFPWLQDSSHYEYQGGEY